MATGKRKLQKDSAHLDQVSYGKAQLERMIELALMLRDRIAVSKRAGISRVRLEMIPYAHAETLINLLDRAIAIAERNHETN